MRISDWSSDVCSSDLSGDEFRRKVRIACQAFNCHRLLRPRLRKLPPLDRFKYVSHKVLRWFGIYFLAAGILAAGGWLLWHGLGLVAVAGAVAAAALYAAGRAGVPRARSEEHTSELPSLMRNSYADLC